MYWEDSYRIIKDQKFEARLKDFDSNLFYRFSVVKERWCILEHPLDKIGRPKVVLVCEDENTGDPLPLGDWIFTRLLEMRQNALRRNKNVNQFFLDECEACDRQKARIQEDIREELEYFQKHEIKEWRKISNELENKPVSDVTAGYQYHKKQKKQESKNESIQKPTDN